MVAPAPRRYLALAVLVAVASIAASCANPDQAAQEGGSSSAGPVAPCPGAPLQFTDINSFSGPLAIPDVSREIEDATTAALRAVNRQCPLGRPIAIDLCDDKSDPNAGQQCGLEAKSNGSLALFGSSGSFATGTAAAQLPGVLTDGSTAFDLTNPDSFSSSSGLTLVAGAASIAAGLDKKEMLLVAADTPATEAFATIAQSIGKAEGVKIDVLFVPATTTDYSSVAAQVSERKPETVGIALATPVPFMNALATEGITPKTTPMMTSVILMTPDVLHQLGSLADSLYLLTQQVPPSDSTNPGIRQMLLELRQAGFPAIGDQLSPASTAAWSDVHTLVSILDRLPRRELKTLTSADVVRAMNSAGPIDRPEEAPFDFRTLAFSDISALAGFRFFSRDAMVVRIDNGHYKAVTSFSDVTKPFDLGS